MLSYIIIGTPGVERIEVDDSEDVFPPRVVSLIPAVYIFIHWQSYHLSA